jgi:hypothetical protein
MPSRDYLADLRASADYNPVNKRRFHQAAETLLRRLAKQLDAAGIFGTRDPIRHNYAGIAVSGEVTLHYDHLYVQVSQSMLGDNVVMFRDCKSRNDYSGGANRFATAAQLCDTDELARRIIQIYKVKVL